MAIEIERKFLVCGDSWRVDAGPGRCFCQGYLARTDKGSVRVRRSGETAAIAVRSKREGISRSEFEYAVPVDEAETMLRDLCVKPLIEKVRYEVVFQGETWEVDVYCGAAEGLVLVEIELDDPHQKIAPPPWVGEEVTFDPRYRSAAIAQGEWPAGSFSRRRRSSGRRATQHA